MMSKFPITNRELSWLEFNRRVLFEAKDPEVPLLEKCKFLSIFSSNLDEFFMIRVSGVKSQVDAGYNKKDYSGFTPKELLNEINNLSHKLASLQSKIFDSVRQRLEKKHIYFVGFSPNLELDDSYDEIFDNIFENEVYPFLTPVTVSPANPFPFIYNKRLVVLSKVKKNDEEGYSLIIVPDNIKRYFKIKTNRDTIFVTVETIIKKFISRIMKGYEVLNTTVFRLTRDADLNIQDERAEDLLSLIEKELSKRKKGAVVRVEIDPFATEGDIIFLKDNLNFTDDSIFKISVPLDLTFLMKLKLNLPSLVYKKFAPVWPEDTGEGKDIFRILKERDILFTRPYSSFVLVSSMLKAAAEDDNTISIKLTVYRLDNNSSIVQNLISAARRGIQVTVVIELKARFDEAQNVKWGKMLEEAGCIVTYGIPGLKIHSKNMLIVKNEEGRIVRYSHISTGNYNEVTANMYTDIDFLTSDLSVGQDTVTLFNFLTGYTDISDMTEFYLAPDHLREKVISLIDNEIMYSKKGKKGKIIVKLNSVIDKTVIDKLYEAAAAGVQIDMIIRGINGLQTGLKEVGDNIKIKSIIGRFLEHQRILYFRQGGKHSTFITTADWMPRNLYRRVELLFEVKDKTCKKTLIDILEKNLADNQKSWILHGQIYQKHPSDKHPFNVQEAFIRE